jgi:hypothetical protein
MNLTDDPIRGGLTLRTKTVTILGCILLLIGAAIYGCADSSQDDRVVRDDTLTRRQRDSIIGASKLPGAKAVQRALDVADSASARTIPLDSLIR